MQVLVPFPGNPEDYLASAAEHRMTPPDTCPNCGTTRRLRFHGYYERYVSTRKTGEAVLLRIRRYRCRDCFLTTSLLPLFCLSYRLVRGESVARFLRGDGVDACDLQWLSLLANCQRRFDAWFLDLAQQLQDRFAIPLDRLASRSGWTEVEGSLGDIATATRRLVARCGITLFGRYRCHTPGLRRSTEGGDHTHPLFSSGTDPPK